MVEENLMGGKVWTKEDDRECLTLTKQGYTGAEVAEELGRRSKYAVYKRLARCGRNKGRVGTTDPVARSQTIAMLARGMTVPEVAAARGVREQSVRQMVSSLVAEGILHLVGTVPVRPGKGWRAKLYKPTAKWTHDSVTDDGNDLLPRQRSTTESYKESRR